MTQADYKNTSNSKPTDSQIWQWWMENFQNDYVAVSWLQAWFMGTVKDQRATTLV
jgi:hypothetical protein